MGETTVYVGGKCIGYIVKLSHNNSCGREDEGCIFPVDDLSINCCVRLETAGTSLPIYGKFSDTGLKHIGMINGAKNVAIRPH